MNFICVRSDQPTCPGIAEGDDGIAGYGPVCPMVWEGRPARGVPMAYPIVFLVDRTL